MHELETIVEHLPDDIDVLDLYLVTRYFEWPLSCIIDLGDFVNITDMITDLMSINRNTVCSSVII